MATLADFRARFPEFDGVADGRVQIFLDDAALLMASPDRWLDFYDVAHAYHVAHLLTVSIWTSYGDAGAIGPVKKKEVDDVVIEKAVGAGVTPTTLNWFSTSYGQQYYQYLRVCFTGIYGV